MKKAILILFFAVALCQVSNAQSKNSIFYNLKNIKSRSTIEKENELYLKRIDSLQQALDELKFQKAVEDSIVNEFSPAADTGFEANAYSAEVTDSLMDIWMHSRRITDYDPVSDLSDTTVFTSNVSDEELQRRLEAINSFITLPFNSIVKRYMIVYSEKNPQLMQEVLGLSQYYMPAFEEIFAKYDLPLELKYMAIIESRLNPTAVSRAGARGMWQFMYGTAKSYGLKINSFMDERYDAFKATDAAARYLRDAYEVFGDWCLAISSYNCGPGNVNKAIRRAGSRKFWDVYDFLPRETRGYVPAFVGAMYAMNYYKEYGIVPLDMGMPAAVDTFEIKKNLHFRQINEVVGVPMEILKELNPQYTHEIIPGTEGSCILKLPYSWSGPFLDADQDSLYLHKSDNYLNPKIIKDLQDQSRQERIAYKVKSGDYLGRIASRYHVTVKQIMNWNHMRNTNIRAGQVLYIYRR